ncbi:MAG TPA: hypothetical protein VN643_11980 [Pyrinomonadaceae bacterium]|nr:hypothetical protein [Pyrinomonadaceae bacterium]
MALIINRWGMDPNDFAEEFLRNHRLPAYGAYLFQRSAASWLNVSDDEAQIRKGYEAGSLEEFGLREIVAQWPTVNVVGLAIGDGLGELEIVRKLLNEEHTVHYLAIDLSPSLLVAHLQKIREELASELRAGRLLCAGVIGDVFTDIQEAVNLSRAEFESRGAIEGEQSFLPRETPLIATFLGNCLGNDLPGREGLIFAAVAAAFSNNRPLAIIVGVSVMRDELDQYSSSWSDFLLETPVYLLRELKVLSSSKPKLNNEADEFFIPDDDLRSVRCPPVPPETYSFHGIEGQVYRFLYRLSFDIEAPLSGVSLAAGSQFLLYSITKYDPASLARFLENQGYTALYKPEYHQRVETELGLREYVVLAALIPA